MGKRPALGKQGFNLHIHASLSDFDSLSRSKESLYNVNVVFPALKCERGSMELSSFKVWQTGFVIYLPEYAFIERCSRFTYVDYIYGVLCSSE